MDKPDWLDIAIRLAVIAFGLAAMPWVMLALFDYMNWAQDTYRALTH
jgi:hypothetical protein